MVIQASLDSSYVPSEDVVARVIEGEMIIIPLTTGIGDLDDELYTLNETGQAIWQKLDGKRSLRDVALELEQEFSAAPGKIEADVVGLCGELLGRKMLIAISG